MSIIFIKCVLRFAINGSISASGIPGLYITLMIMVEILTLSLRQCFTGIPGLGSDVPDTWYIGSTHSHWTVCNALKLLI